MPGIHFSLRMSEEEIAALTAGAVDDLVRDLVARAFERLPWGEQSPAQAEALARLHMLVHLRQAIERLEENAAHEAADAGAGYPQIGRASNMTRQGARRRWPGLITHDPTPHDTPRSSR
ncbi:hypothetical protein [Streptomyces sp. MI02-7b]|uniref:hypothetical protein n=1 Tax=Streptomyces sp. MI02-7b TaxID=462941 RepID=UPI0029A62ED4|nr:hypothetical protein [Streptomyces sp. MI02-7b]MDX3074086.1 hypothetical protein [Streptomyces sp. MI02-7b]